MQLLRKNLFCKWVYQGIGIPVVRKGSVIGNWVINGDGCAVLRVYMSIDG